MGVVSCQSDKNSGLSIPTILWTSNESFTKNNKTLKELSGECHNWASSWENLFMTYANTKGADQPAHPRCLISAFIVRSLDSIILLPAIAEIARP